MIDINIYFDQVIVVEHAIEQLCVDTLHTWMYKRNIIVAGNHISQGRQGFIDVFLDRLMRNASVLLVFNDVLVGLADAKCSCFPNIY